MDDRRFLITAHAAGFHVQILINNQEKMSQHWTRDSFREMLERTRKTQLAMNANPNVIGTFDLYITSKERDEPLLLDNDAAFTQAILAYS
jgi:hypothetical protein